MKTVDVNIVGVTPLLQHRFEEQNEMQASARRVNLPRDVAERAAYRDRGGALYIPGAAISRLLREAGGGLDTQRGLGRSLRYLTPAAVLIDDAVGLFVADGSARVTDFEVDARTVRTARGGRVVRYRPRLDAWSARFRLRVNEAVLGLETVHQLLIEGGQRIGIGSFRPERGGPFGTFRVTEWREGES